MIALTTTAAKIDEELLNRCLVLSVDEGRSQTQAIRAAQRARRTLAGPVLPVPVQTPAPVPVVPIRPVLPPFMEPEMIPII